MFKLVVLCVFVAAAAAEPSGAFFAQPLTYSSTVISPAVTTISKSASSVVHPSPTYYYNTPTIYSHFIKKRSAPLYYPTTYAAGSPFVSSTYYSAPILHNTPLVSGTPLLSAPIAAAPFGYATHLIKKRSAPLFAPATYSTYTPFAYSTPLAYSTQLGSAAPIYSTPVVAHAPVAYHHLIKKRSAPFLASTYIAPTAITHQSRFDLRTPYITHYTTPLAYTSPYAYTHVY